MTANETQLNYINVTDLRLKDDCEILVVAVNNVGRTTSDQIHVRVGTPYAQFGIIQSVIILCTSAESVCLCVCACLYQTGFGAWHISLHEAS